MLCGAFISVVLNSTDERGDYIYFNSLYQVAFKEGQIKWKNIGSALDLDPNDIDAIEKQSKPGDCFRQMLLKWFQVNEECYLSTFNEALEARNVELFNLIPRVEAAIFSRTEEIQKSEYKTLNFHLSIASCKPNHALLFH